MTLTYIIAAALLGGLLSVSMAALLAWRVQPKLIPVFVSFAVGALLGVVFLDLIPHIFESSKSYSASAGWILAGILGFFVMEKLVLWRHSHDHGASLDLTVASGPQKIYAADHGHAHEHSKREHGGHASAWMVIIGDGFHNFTDGLAIAAAFVADVRLGILTSIAIIAHELPQELGNFLVLVHSGFSKRRALVWNLLSSLATLVGAVLAYFLLQAMESYANIFLCLAASSMIYVAIADLIPGLHRRTSLRDSFAQFSLIGLGILSIWSVHLVVGHSH
ncbi:MAG: ZIP family metal transporter [Aeromicrobium sp.]|nr:ZIP family metal transporter [Burkholderiales bacterium]